jgi:hypothetical protein
MEITQEIIEEITTATGIKLVTKQEQQPMGKGKATFYVNGIEVMFYKYKCKTDFFEEELTYKYIATEQPIK